MRENGENSRQRQPRGGRMARVLGVLALVVAACALMAGPAFAEYTFKGTFAGPGAGSGDGEFTTPGRAAVEPSTGDLFVVDSGNDRVQVFKPNAAGTAEYLTQFGGGELSEPWGIALAEEAGTTYVYVADAGNARIVKYESDGAATPSFTVDPSFTSPAAGAGAGEVGSFHAALAVDPITGDLLVADDANKRVERFEADGTFVSSFDGTDGGSALEGPIDLAVNSTGDVYVVDANGNIAEAQGTSKVLRYHADGEYVTTLGPVGTHERPASVAVNPANDEVIVSGDQDSVYEAGPAPFVPVLQVFDSSNQPLPSPVVNTGATFDTVSGLAIAGGNPDHLYVVFDVGHYFGSPYGSPQVQAFRQPHPAAPTILAQGATPTEGEAVLTGTIATGEDRTEYHFEWGSTPGYGNVTPTRLLGVAEGTARVSASVTGLTAGATYHYRLVATNSKGTAVGADKSFVTGTRPAPEACPNATMREAESATELPECRAYEMVSPVDKNGNEVTGFYTVQAAPDGERVVYGSTGAFPGSEGAFSASEYLSTRDGDGWATRAMTPPQLNSTEVLGGVSRDFSDDLTRAMTFSRLALAPGAVAGNSNMYFQNTVSGSLEYAGGTPDPAFFNLSANSGGSSVKGASSDLRHAVVIAESALTPDAIEGQQNIYDVTSSGPRLVNILPDGSVATAPPVFLDGENTGTSAVRPVSADGTRILFESGGRLYVRIGGTHTVEVSAPEPLVELTGSPNARLGAASADGSTIFFTARARLTVAGEPEPGAGFPPARLYRWSNGQLEELAISESGFASAIRVLGVTEDGSTAYFAVINRPEAGSPSATKVYRWTASEGVTEAFALEYLNEFDEVPQDWSTSPDGRFAAFEAVSFLTPNAQPGTCSMASSSGHQVLDDHCFEVYVFDAVTGEVSCASCSPFGEEPTGASTLGTLFQNEGSTFPLQISRHAPRGIADDGTVYFDSPSRLTANDGDGKRDVYEWMNGKVSLLTPNTPTDAVYADASADGSTVFVLTSSKLVGQDRDGNRDIYAVRRDGGIAAQNPAAERPTCEGDPCQGSFAQAPISIPPGSAALKAAGTRRVSGKAKLNLPSRVRIHGSTGWISVKVSGPGLVMLKGAGLRSASHRFRQSGSARVRLALTKTGARRLRRTGLFRGTAAVTFRPSDGAGRTQRVDVKFVTGNGA